jgi:hypothetical protein
MLGRWSTRRRRPAEGDGACSGGRAPSEDGGAPGKGDGACPGGGAPGKVGITEVGLG